MPSFLGSALKGNSPADVLLSTSGIQICTLAEAVSILSMRTPTALNSSSKTTVTASTIPAHLETSEELDATGTYASVSWISGQWYPPSYR